MVTVAEFSQEEGIALLRNTRGTVYFISLYLLALEFPLSIAL